MPIMFCQRFSSMFVLLVCLTVCGTDLAAETSNDAIDYQRDVAPVLRKYCVGCHTPDAPEAGLALETYDSLMQGGDSGVAVTPGETGSSRLMLMVSGRVQPQMPPEGEPRPTTAEQELLAAWIEQGAVGPSGPPPLKRTIVTPEIKPVEDVSLPITAIDVSPDGSLRALARYGQIQLTRPDGTILRTIEKGISKISSMRFNRDASRLLVANGMPGVYGGASIFDTQSGKLLKEMVGHRDMVYAAEFSPDEAVVATGGYDRDIILWDLQTGEPIRHFVGHNGAIFDLAFSQDGQVLVSGCADETAKVWHVATGERLDTLGQPEGEVLTVGVTLDNRFVLAGSADNRLRVWRLQSVDQPTINPLIATRFVDESPLVDFQLSPDGQLLAVLSEAGNLKLLETGEWNQVSELEPLSDVGSDLHFDNEGTKLFVSLMNGDVVTRNIPPELSAKLTGRVDRESSSESTPTIILDLPRLMEYDENELRETHDRQPHDADVAQEQSSLPLSVKRGAVIRGTIRRPGESDHFQWYGRQGELWAIDADPVQPKSMDPIVTILDEHQQPVLRTRLQAVRDSYFTFRGKDSKQNGDFRLFNWQEMNLNDYLYAAGEVTRLWMHPRGPDSGFIVYPGEGDRWTYFGTTHTTHALGEPAYIVRPLAPDETPVANGLPVFDVYYVNDDDPMREYGTSSRLLFKVPRNGRYTAQITDTRGAGGEDYRYRLTIRNAQPSFNPSVNSIKKPLRPGTGREFSVRVERIDGFHGPVTFDIPDLPPDVVANVPLTIEAGQRFAVGTIWIPQDVSPDDWTPTSPQVVARAEIAGRVVERRVGTVGKLEVGGEAPSVIPSIQPSDREIEKGKSWVLQVPRGQTVTARVVLQRKDEFDAEVSMGKEKSGRNATHGVYVDNIGLNGLLVRAGETEREFFLTADPVAQPGTRSFFLTAQVDGNLTTQPITVEVLP